MPALEYPTDEELASWGILWDHGAGDASTLTNEIGIDMNTGRRKALVNWDNRFDFVKYVLGCSDVWDDAGTLKLSRLLPRTFPGVDWLVATKCVSMVPFCSGQDWEEGEVDREWDGVATFDKAAVEFLYEQVPYKLREDGDTSSELDRYIEQPAGNPEPAADALQLPGGMMKYTEVTGVTPAASVIAGTPIPFGLNKIVPMEKFRATWHRLPFEDIWNDESPLYQRIYGVSEGDDVPFFGAVNTVEIFGKPIGTVCLTGVFPIVRRGIDGNRELDLTFEFTYKPSGWNWCFGARANDLANNAWYPATFSGTYTTAADVDDNDSIHNGRDLNELFSVAEA